MEARPAVCSVLSSSTSWPHLLPLPQKQATDPGAGVAVGPLGNRGAHLQQGILLFCLPGHHALFWYMWLRDVQESGGTVGVPVGCGSCQGWGLETTGLRAGKTSRPGKGRAWWES